MRYCKHCGEEIIDGAGSFVDLCEECGETCSECGDIMTARECKDWHKAMGNAYCGNCSDMSICEDCGWTGDPSDFVMGELDVCPEDLGGCRSVESAKPIASFPNLEV